MTGCHTKRENFGITINLIMIMGLAVSSSPPLVFSQKQLTLERSKFFTFKPDLRFIIEHIFSINIYFLEKLSKYLDVSHAWRIEYILEGKTYINQGTAISMPYMMLQICVLRWEEIKTKNSGAKHQLCGGGGDNNIYCYRTHEK